MLKGAEFFLTALARAITVPVKSDFLAISKDLDEGIENEDVPLVADDTLPGAHARRSGL